MDRAVKDKGIVAVLKQGNLPLLLSSTNPHNKAYKGRQDGNATQQEEATQGSGQMQISLFFLAIK